MNSGAANLEVNKSIKPRILVYLSNEAQLEKDQQRRDSRKILDQLSIGERFMLMFGRGEVKHNPLRVEWKQ